MKKEKENEKEKGKEEKEREKRVSVPPSRTSFTVGDLKSAHKYRVSIRAETDAGFSNWSESVSFTTCPRKME